MQLDPEKSENLQYKIVANSSATDAEVAVIKDAAVEARMGNVFIEKTGGTTDLGADGAPEVILLIKYTGAALTGGILAAIGKDIWEQVKKFVATIFQRYQNEQRIYNPFIVVDLCLDNTSKIQICFPRNSGEELSKSIESLTDIFDLYIGEDFAAFKFENGKWMKTKERFKSQEQIRDEIFGQHNSGVVQDVKTPRKPFVFGLLRLMLVLIFVFGVSTFITKELTPPDYTIHFKRECDGVKCEKVKTIDSERNTSIENEIETLSSTLDRLNFFTRFTFLRFDFQITNKSQILFVVTAPRYEKGIDIMMLCNLNGQNYVLSPNSGIVFEQKSSIGNIIEGLNKIQDILMACNPAPQSNTNIIDQPVEVAPNAQVQLIYNEETYHLRFLPDTWNYPLTVLQMFILSGIFLGAYYNVRRFVWR